MDGRFARSFGGGARLWRVERGAALGAGAGLTPSGPVGNLDDLAPDHRSWSGVTVCVRFLRTQQRVKNRCQLPRFGVWPGDLRPCVGVVTVGCRANYPLVETG